MIRLRPALQAGIPRKPYISRREPTAGPHLGMVVATYAADDPTVQGRTNPPQILCDVMMARGGILRAQVMQRGSSVSNVDRWVPRPVQTNIATGAAVKFTQDGLDPAPSNLYDLDGDLVLVSYVGANYELPIIIGSIEHPRGTRGVPTAYAVPTVAQGQPMPMQSAGDIGSRYVAHQGTQAQIDRAGNVRLDLRGAGVANDATTYAAANTTAGNVDVAVRAGSEVVVRNQAGVPVVRVIVQTGGNISARVGASPTDTVLIATPTIEHLTAWESSTSGIGERVEALWAAVNIAAATANATNTPTPILIEPGAPPALALPYVWAPPPTAQEVQVQLRSGIVRLDPTPEG